MKKILLNAYLNLNFGDDLFLKILFDRYPNTKWILPKGGSVYKRVFENYKNVIIKENIFFKIRKKLNMVEKNKFYSSYDAGLYIGGSIFMQIPNWESQYKERKEVIESFYKKKKPYFILGSNFGPFTKEEFKELYRDLFSKSKDICFREKYSYDMFKELDNVRIAPDIVFQLPVHSRKKIKDSIGISLIDLSDREDLVVYEKEYCSKIKEVVIKGIDLGKSITFFSFCKAQGDEKVIEKIIESIGEEYKNKIKTVYYSGNIDDFLNKFSSMENIIGTRFHACVLSQVFNQGLYPIIYSNKTLNVLEDINLDKEFESINNIKNLDIDNLFKIIDNNKIKDRSIIKKSENQFKILDKYCK